MTDSEEHEFIGETAALMGEVKSRSEAELQAGLAAIEARYEARLAGRPAAILEVRRRIAEWALTIAEMKQRPVAECERRLAHIEALGVSEVLYHAYRISAFSRYCLEQGDPETGLRHLGPMLRVVEDGAAPWRDEVLPLLRKLHDDLERSRAGEP